jgi:ribonuclease D
LTNTLVAYAIQSVVHLLNLRLRLLEECDRTLRLLSVSENGGMKTDENPQLMAFQ